MKKGTTLIEILLYFTLLSVVMLAAMTFSLQLFQSSQMSQNLGNLYAEKEIISSLLTNTIKKALSIDSQNSIFDDNSGAISLNMSDPAENPTRFYYQNNNIYLQKANNPATAINTSSVSVTQLRFQKISASKSPDQIIMDATLNGSPLHITITLNPL